MTYGHAFSAEINLFIQGRISPEDAERQTITAIEILKRLVDQPGLILADEVGMGKTYVSLAVAISVALADAERRPVVVMIPPALREKWPREFDVFCQHCLPRESRALQCGVAERPVEFFKLLDDPPQRRRQVIFLTHGAMSRRLADPWVRLALIQRSLYRRHNTGPLRAKIEKALPSLLMLKGKIESQHPDMLAALLDVRPERWLRLMRDYGYSPEDNDDPVPETVIHALAEMDLTPIYELLHDLPAYRTATFEDRITNIRQRLNDALHDLWTDVVKRLRLRLPLLIMDEAHHLKNARTRLSRLFDSQEAEEDARQAERGALGGVFERMLFLTATPFQLGHNELCSVLRRFRGICWSGDTAPAGGVARFDQQIETLGHRLDAAQQAALRLDACWGVLTAADLTAGTSVYRTTESWWKAIDGQEELTEAGRQIVERYGQTQEMMRAAQDSLRPWIIRHLRSRVMPANAGPFTTVPRRRRLAGAAINQKWSDQQIQDCQPPGIRIAGVALLPFLLAARSAAIAPSTRPIFAEGLASSYEAFLRTREVASSQTAEGEAHLTDEDDDADVKPHGSEGKAGISENWHLEQLSHFVRQGGVLASAAHPKVSATVEKAVSLWLAGEKVLVFCHYVVTGRLLRRLISERLAAYLQEEGARLLKCGSAEAEDELTRLGERFFDVDSPWRRVCDAQVRQLLKSYDGLRDRHEDLIDMVRRYVRTPTFLVRYFPLGDIQDPEAAIRAAFSKKDSSGLTLNGILSDFFQFLDVRCGQAEKNAYLQALERVQVGVHGGAKEQEYTEDEVQGEKGRLLPNVRLVNGGTAKETRQTIMLSFNTPFYPEILIASSVMAEGVDLHLNCRQVIHHDLSWNPSSLEQRNGRVDRIGAKAERCAQPIDIYYPYLAETQDDKMYQVVMDRERWFSVVMGDRYDLGAKATDKLAERLPFPEAAAQGLAFDLGLKAASWPALSSTVVARAESENALIEPT